LAKNSDSGNFIYDCLSKIRCMEKWVNIGPTHSSGRTFDMAFGFSHHIFSKVSVWNVSSDSLTKM
jgi:hypothetical protein